MKPVCQLDSNGFYTGLTEADESPLEPGVLLLPAGAVDTTPPNLPEGHAARWNASTGAWDYVDQRPPAPTVEQVLSSYTSAIQRRLDEFAATRGYTNLLSACSYATSSVPRFRAEGAYCAVLRDATWHQCYAILEEVNVGTRTAPTFEELLAELPTPEWPA